MKRSVLIVLALMLVASMAFAQNGSIMVFSDIGASDCNWSDAAPALQPVYIFHMYSPGATGSEWMLTAPATWSHLGDQPDFALVIGSSVAGASVSYETCLAGNFKLMTVNFFGSGLEGACTLFSIGAAPGKTGVQVIDCADGRGFPPGGAGIVNSDGTCDCSVPVNETTWGGIKALYN
jgi:hypothetical protein